MVKRGVEDVVKRGLRTFDLGREERLLAHIHGKEHLHIGNVPRSSFEISQFCFRCKEQRIHLFVELDGRIRREGCRNERTISLGSAQVLTNEAGSRIVADHRDSTSKI